MDQKIFLRLLAFGLLILLAISCAPDKSRNPNVISNFDQLRGEFKDPSEAFGTIPFFVWNGKITRQDIDSFMIDFREAGCGGVFIHARPGLITSYLTDEWFELFKYTVNKGKELGLTVWIYDEYNFPSGFAGGNVPAQMPESYNLGQGIQMKKSVILPDDVHDYYLILKEEEGHFVEITGVEEESDTIGEYWLFKKAYYNKGDNDYYFHGKWYGGFTYVDLLYPGVTEKFIQVTMDGYEKFTGDEFGKFMPGIFTDEPHLNSPGGIRWTPDLFERFEEQWGFDLKMHLPSLFEEVGDWKKIRHNYAQTLLQLFIERWAKPYYEYTEKKGLILTGHYWEHTWPSIRLGPDNMAMYPWFQIPGIDMLFNQFNESSTSAQFGNVRSVKELSSVANQFGLSRTLCETYGGAGWDLTFADMKRLGDWEYALGVNLMNQHMSPITIEGYRKYDHPPYFTYHEPWWEYYKYLNRYFARLSLTLSSGKQKNDVLVIEPTTTSWMFDSYDKPNEKRSQIGNTFQEFVTNFEKAQIEYDLGSENIIREQGKIENGKFIIGHSSYSKVVIPPLTENLNAPTFELLEEYIDQGGMLFLYSIPSMTDGSPDTEMSDFFKSKSGNITILKNKSARETSSYFNNPDLKFENITGGNLYHHRRVLDDGQILFLANSSLDEATEGVLSISGNDAVELHAFTGELTAYPYERNETNNIRLLFNLPPAGSLLLFISGSKVDGIREIEKPADLVPVQSASPMSVNRESDNVLMIDFCDLFIEDEVMRDLNVLDAADRVYNHYGFDDGDPWSSYVQYKNCVMVRDTFGSDTWFTVKYHFQLEGDFDLSGMKAVVERPDVWSVLMNGKKVERIPGKWWLDRNFGVFDISSMVKPGENELTLHVSPMNLMAEVQPVYITGDFSVVPARKGWSVKEPPATYTTGSWSGQGMPFLSRGVFYTRSFDIQEPDGNYKVQLGEWTGTVSEITVNGNFAGIIAFPPFTLDVSEFIREGNNTIGIKVIGSLKNLLGPHHNNPPEGLAISPLWRGISQYPPGEEYQILDYGLMDDFHLLKEGVFFYQKKDTWQETMRCSMEAMMDYYNKSGQEGSNPVQVGPWYIAGPFPAENLEEVFLPEEMMDLMARDDKEKLLWRQRSDFKDGEIHIFPGEKYTTTYLWRKITVPSSVTITGSFSGKDATEVWLNGDKIIQSYISRGLEPDKDRALLHFKPGDNHLVMKIFTRVGTPGFYFKALPEPLCLATFLWPLVEKDFPDSLSTRQMNWEKEDGIWSTMMPYDEIGKVAECYIRSFKRPSFVMKASQIADTITSEDALSDLRQLYYRDHLFYETWESIKDFNFSSLRAAIRDLQQTFPEEYENGDYFISELSRLEQEFKSIQSVFLSQREASFDENSFLDFAMNLLSIRRKALISNPLVYAQPVLYVLRQQYWGSHGPTNTMYQNGEEFPHDVGGLKAWRSDGSALKLITFDRDGGIRIYKTLIEIPSGMIRDPDISYDGDRILFSMRNDKADDYHIYEINSDGSGLRQLTWGTELADTDPVYMPDGHIVFSSTRDLKYCHCNIQIQPNLFRMEEDGANIVQIGGGHLWEGHPSMLQDGRILYSRWEYIDRQFGPSFGLWTMYPDGTNQTLFYGNNAWTPSAILDGRVIPGTELVSCTFGNIHNLPWGSMAIVDRRYGLDGSNPVLKIWPSENRKLLENLDNVDWTPYKIDRLNYSLPKYEDPYPLADPVSGRGAGKYFLVSRSVGKVIHHYESTTETNASYALMGLFLIDTFGNELLLHAEEPGCYDPMPLCKKMKPAAIPSRVNFAENKGWFYLEDIYQGTGMELVSRGTIKFLRIVEAPPKRQWSENGWSIDAGQSPAMNWNVTISKAIIGDVPVEEDGSAYFEIPANRFVYFQALDKDKMMIQSMRSGTMVQPGEVSGCIGCHENRLQAAPGRNISAMKHKADVPQEWYGPSREFNYLTEVQPVFDNHCTVCHDYGKPAGEVLNLAGDPGLVFNTSYIDIHRKSAIRWFPDSTDKKLIIKVIHDGPPAVLPPYAWGSHRSRMIDILKNGHYDVALSEEDLERIVTWIDLNAPYYGRYSAVYSENPFARSPLTYDQLKKLIEILEHSYPTEPPNTYFSKLEKKEGSQISFTRPELSRILTHIGDKNSLDYQQALEIILKGKEQLQDQPREDMQECTEDPIYLEDVIRNERYLRLRDAEKSARQAISEGVKFYPFRPSHQSTDNSSQKSHEKKE